MAFDPYQNWLGIPPAEQPPNHYRLLDLPLFESDQSVINDAADQQMTLIQTYKLGPHSDASQKLLNELAAARICLLNVGKKAAYDAQLRAKDAPAPDPADATGETVAVPSPDASAEATQSAEPLSLVASGMGQPTPPAATPPAVDARTPTLSGSPDAAIAPAVASEPPGRLSRVAAVLRRAAVVGGSVAASLLLTILLAAFFGAETPETPVEMLAVVGEATSPSANNNPAPTPTAPLVAQTAPRPHAEVTGAAASPVAPVMGAAAAEATSKSDAAKMVASGPRPALAAPSGPPIPPTADEARETLDQASEAMGARIARVAGELIVANEDAAYTPPTTEEMVRWAAGRKWATPTEAELREARSQMTDFIEKYRQEILAKLGRLPRQGEIVQHLLEASRRGDNARAFSVALLERAHEEADQSDFHTIWKLARDAELAGLDGALWKRAAVEQGGARAVRDFDGIANDVVQCWIELSDIALRNGDHARAVDCIAQGVRIARTAKDKVAIALVDDRRKQLVVASPAFESAALAKQRVEADPTDRAAAAEWGRYLCLGRGDFANGLAFLSQGADEAAEAARRELRRPANDAERVERGRLWMKVAATAKDPLEQRHAHQRAVAWYQLAPSYLGDPEGAERRAWLADYRGVKLAFPPGEQRDALLLLDLALDGAADVGWEVGVGGYAKAPKREPAGRDDPVGPATLTIPFTFTGDYEIRFDFDLEGVRRTRDSYRSMWEPPEHWGDCRLVFPVGRERLKFGTVQNGNLALRDANDAVLADLPYGFGRTRRYGAEFYEIKVQYITGWATVEVWTGKERLVRREFPHVGPLRSSEAACLQLETTQGGVEVKTLDVRVLSGAAKYKQK